MSKPEISVDQLIDLINNNLKLNVKYEYIEPTSVYIDEPLRRCLTLVKQ